VPIYLAALTSQAVELAGEIADGVMPLWWSVDRVARSRRWIKRGPAKSGGRGKLDLTLGLPTYIGEDIDALRAAARAYSPPFHSFSGSCAPAALSRKPSALSKVQAATR